MVWLLQLVKAVESVVMVLVRQMVKLMVGPVQVRQLGETVGWHGVQEAELGVKHCW